MPKTKDGRPSKKQLKEAARTRKKPVLMKHWGRNIPTIVSAGSAPEPQKRRVPSPQQEAFAKAYRERYGNGHNA
jgi:hypothetical protein